jgi:predicted 3-demethylubiquinone-9 3-methyltransferase (glyoxalase superfamily)
MQKITPCLWFDDKAEEAANFYVSVFRNSRILKISRFPEGSPRPTGMVMTVSFIIDGQEFMALNGGPEFKFTPAVSFVVNCETQEGIDYFWEKLSEGGELIECGWLTDRFGVTWQVVPIILDELLSAPDAAAAQRVMAAMLRMKKIEIEPLKRAFDNV